MDLNEYMEEEKRVVEDILDKMLWELQKERKKFEEQIESFGRLEESIVFSTSVKTFGVFYVCMYCLKDLYIGVIRHGCISKENSL